MRTRTPGWAAGALGLLVAASAAAAPQPEIYMPGGSRFGRAIMVGGGFQDFVDTGMRDRTNGGGAWDLRFVGGTRSFLGFEAAYVGAANNVDTLGISPPQPTIISNGVEGTIRI